jgi:hypothetical protein
LNRYYDMWNNDPTVRVEIMFADTVEELFRLQFELEQLRMEAS